MDRRLIRLDPASSQVAIAAALRRAFAVAGERSCGLRGSIDDEFDALLSQLN